MPQPRKVTEKLLQEAADAIALGKTLRDFCREPGRPSRPQITRAIQASPEWQEKFTEARKLGFDALAEEGLEIIDTDPGTGPKGGKDPGAVQWLRLRFEGRMRLLAKWDTARYGERVQVAGDPNAPLTRMTDEQVRDEIVSLLETATKRRLAKSRISANGNGKQ